MSSEQQPIFFHRVVDGQKYCRKCEQYKPATDEEYGISVKTGKLLTVCFECRKELKRIKQREKSTRYRGVLTCIECESTFPNREPFFATDFGPRCNRCINDCDIGILLTALSSDLKQCTKCKVIKLATKKFFAIRESVCPNVCRDCTPPRIAHRERQQRRRANGRKYRVLNREMVNERKRKYRKANREMVNEQSRKRRVRKRNLPATFTLTDWKRALDYFNGCCAVCDRQLYDLFADRTAAVDHWIPLAYKGTDNPGHVATNIVPLCHGIGGCNNFKHKKPAAVWLTERYGKRKAREILGRIEAYFEWVEEKAEAAFAASRPAPEHRRDMRESIP